MRDIIEKYESMGFDKTTVKHYTTRLGCSGCDCYFINGIACHETGCPNTTYECKGCNEILDYQGYCAECS